MFKIMLCDDVLSKKIFSNKTNKKFLAFYYRVLSQNVCDEWKNCLKLLTSCC